MRACRRHGLGELDSVLHALEVVGVQCTGQPAELHLFLGLRVIQNVGLQLLEHLLELSGIDVQLLEFGERAFCFVLLLQPCVDDVRAVGELTPCTRVDDLLLSCFVHREKAAQLGEAVASLVTRRGEDLAEQLLDALMLTDQE